MERLPIWLSAVGERTAGPGTADMNRFLLNGMRQLRLPMALIERPVQGHSNEEGTGAPQHHPDVSLRGGQRPTWQSHATDHVFAWAFLISDMVLRDCHGPFGASQ